jgi:hypothetical protein
VDGRAVFLGVPGPLKTSDDETMSEDTPSQTAVDGRDRRGRFAVGNRASKGNVIARKAAQCRAKLFSTVKGKDFQGVVRKVVSEAQRGRPWACKLLFAYLIGRPIGPDILSRIEALEVAQQGRQR